MPNAMVIRTAGTNCDRELCRAFELAGASVELLHLHGLLRDPSRLDGADLIGFPGGFSYGDDVASGRLFAMRARRGLRAPLERAVSRGCPIIGVCNGFQVLVQVGLLPGGASGGLGAQEATLTVNETGGFIDEWVGMTVEPSTRCVWTRGLAGLDAGGAFGGDFALPIAHGEGRFVASEPVLDRLEASGQVVVRYTENVNGSSRSIAGICDVTGRVFGLMPHPERFLEWTRHPSWTRLRDGGSGETPAFGMFRNAVEAASRLPA